MLPDGSDEPAVLDCRFPGPPSPRQALEAAIRPALIREPCVVDFSGGRDSSLVLAVAADLARREGLAPPIPRTRRFAGDAASDETSWQEMVIRHLKLDNWERVDFGDRLDIVGELAQRFLRRYGVLFPAPTFVATESIAAARGGSHMSGEGGDEMLSLHRAGYLRHVLESPRAAVGRLRKNPQRRNLLLGLAPQRLRQVAYERQHLRSMPGKAWLTADVAERLAREIGRSTGTEPLSFRRSLAWEMHQRSAAVYQNNQSVIGRDHDVLHVDPLFDVGFVAALARAGGLLGFSSRSAAMEFVAGGLLPEPILERQSKAGFNTAYFTATARRFVESWDGRGLDTSLVDPEVLRTEWSKDLPPANSFMLLQAAWLAAHGDPLPEAPVPLEDGIGEGRQ